MPVAVHPGRLLRRELAARKLSASRLALELGVPSGRITDIPNGKRGISHDRAHGEPSRIDARDVQQVGNHSVHSSNRALNAL